jgi:membrane-bound lytic murein transglycosylase B
MSHPAHLASSLLLLLALLFSAPAQADINRQFTAWLQNDLWPEAARNGVSAETFNAAFRGVSPNLRLPDLVRPGEEGRIPQAQHQAEFGQPSAYFAPNTVAGIVNGGRQRAQRHAAALQALEQRFGVPRGILLAVWGRESAFGTAAIPHNAFEVLGTKAFMARRKEMFRAEVVAALVMLERGYVTADQMKSSWAGALGIPTLEFLEVRGAGRTR